MAKLYTTTEAVQLSLGRTLTLEQAAYATTLLEAAERYIDKGTRRLTAAGYGGWNLSAITAERYEIPLPVHRSYGPRSVMTFEEGWGRGPSITLRFAPVASIQGITTRRPVVGDVPVALTAGTDYELLDPATGEVAFAHGVGSHLTALVSYTPNRPVPADIRHAATLIVAASLYPVLYPDRYGIEQAKVENEGQITYVQDGTEIRIPALAEGIIRHNRLPLAV